jgi:hypothetical protein
MAAAVARHSLTGETSNGERHENDHDFAIRDHG